MIDDDAPDGPARTAPRRVEEQRIPIVEEQLTLGKRVVVTGEVRVRSHVEEVRETLSETLTRDTVQVERVAVGQVVDTAPAIRTEGDVTIVPVLEERLVVQRQLVLVEELRIRRARAAEPVQVSATRRVMRAEVERLPAAADAEPPLPTTRMQEPR